MTLKGITLALTTVSLALGFAATPITFHANSGLQILTAAAKEAESGGRHQEAGDDKGGQKKGGRTGDGHPGSHSQNGKSK